MDLSLRLLAHVVPDGACILLCIVATVYDLRSRRIPNWLTGTGAIAGLLLNSLLPLLADGGVAMLRAGLLPATIGGLLLLVVFGLFAWLGMMGGGDLKLMGAVGLLVRFPVALFCLIYVGLAGGVIAVSFALAKGRLGAVLRNLLHLRRRPVGGSSAAGGARPGFHPMPYAPAILAGVVWAVAAKYIPALHLG